jgi:uncharacterized membrane protein
MAVFDPIPRLKATLKTNGVGSVGGAVAGIVLIKRFTPMRGWLGITIGVIGGAIGGAYLSQQIKAKTGSKKSSQAAKK